MANLTYRKPALTGTDPAHVAASGGGDVVPTHANGFVSVKNADATATTVTINTPGKSRLGVLDEPNITVSVPAGGERLIGPMTGDLVDKDLGGVSLTYSKVTSLTVAAIRG